MLALSQWEKRTSPDFPRRHRESLNYSGASRIGREWQQRDAHSPVQARKPLTSKTVTGKSRMTCLHNQKERLTLPNWCPHAGPQVATWTVQRLRRTRDRAQLDWRQLPRRANLRRNLSPGAISAPRQDGEAETSPPVRNALPGVPSFMERHGGRWAPIVTLSTASMAILGKPRTNDGNQRASTLGIISEPPHLGGTVRVKQTVSKFEYPLSTIIPFAAPRPSKNRHGEGG